MDRFFWKKFRQSTLLWASLAGGCIGVAGAWGMIAFAVTPQFARLEALIRARPTATTTATTTPAPTIESVNIQPRPLMPSYPSAIVTRRRSPVFAVVQRGIVAGKGIEDRLVSSDREIGSAVSVTSDGWFVAPASLLTGTRLADIGLVIDGRVRTIEKAARDQATDVLYLKLTAQDLPPSTFVRADDVNVGSAVWLEPRPQRLYPETIVSVRLAAMTDAVESERAMRRFLVTGESEDRWNGAAVWDAGGRLVGLLDGKARGGWRVLPAGNIANALASLLSTQEIRHASLGIRALDLASAVVEGDRAPLPLQGAWVRSERKTGAPAVLAQGPSVNVLVDGDVIERIERDILDGTSDLGERLLTYLPSASVTLTVERKGKTVDLKVTLGSKLSSEWLLK
jgi:S1-C subfamily serine protease